jgi:DNA polymerase (family X)
VGKGPIVVAGSYRRRRDTVGDLDILITTPAGAPVGDKLTKYENVAKVLANGPTRTTVTLRSGLQVDVRVVAEKSYRAALLYFTGSRAHNIVLRGIANERGWKLNEYGLFNRRRLIGGETEEDIYKKLRLAFVPPELREDRGEIALARQGALPVVAIFMRIPTGATAPRQFAKWPRLPSFEDTLTSPSPITVVDWALLTALMRRD